MCRLAKKGEIKMASLYFNLNFEGYWRYVNRGSVPDKSGVYCVYATTYNSNNNTVTLNRLLYIGESENIRERLSNHEKLKDWERLLKPGEIISFSTVKVDPYYRERVEAAMIFEHKPPVNTEYVYNFPFDETTISTKGDNALLKEHFVVFRTNSRSSLLGW